MRTPAPSAPSPPSPATPRRSTAISRSSPAPRVASWPCRPTRVRRAASGGPIDGAVLPDTWLNEAGQSATGALLDHLIRWHGAGGEPTRDMHEKIIARIIALREVEGAALGDRIHVLPDFHGNRSPIADPNARGVISRSHPRQRFRQPLPPLLARLGRHRARRAPHPRNPQSARATPSARCTSPAATRTIRC